MPVIHTIGPKGTDSYKSALYWRDLKKISFNIVEHEKFEDIFNSGCIKKNDLVIIPAGFCNRSKGHFISWVDIHFSFLDVLEIEDIFYTKTQPMLLLENPECEKEHAIIHSSTYILLINHVNVKDIYYSDSKMKAFLEFQKGHYKYTIVSDNSFTNVSRNKFHILKTFFPSMVWCVYRSLSDFNYLYKAVRSKDFQN